MIKKLWIALLAFGLQAYKIDLPENFCIAAEVAQSKRCTSRSVEFSSPNPVLLFLIHGTFQQADSFLDNVVLNNDPIPADFFENSLYNGAQPIQLSYTWSGKNSDAARLEGGKKFADGLNAILKQCDDQKIIPAIICIAHSHGGNVVAVASNSVSKPIDVAIFLATPVLRYDQNKKKGTDTDLYLPSRIKNLFLFYSMLDMIQTAGALTNDFKRRYGPIKGINLYNTRVLLNGQEPDHSTLYAQIVEDHILQLCAKIQKSYTKNRNLVANIAPKNPAVDKIIAIKNYEPRDASALTGAATDILWPNWQEFTFAESEKDENKISEDARMAFNNFYHYEFIDTMPLIDRAIKAAQLELCNRAIGKVGGSLAFLSSGQKDDVADFCCSFDAFKTQHPNATKALQCATRESHPNKLLNPEENKKFCMNVVGVPGRFLSLMSASDRDALNKRCCSPEFKQKHPQAAQALNCADSI